MTRQLRLPRILSVIALCGGLLAAASTAQAEVRTFTDPAGDAANATDIRSVRVQYAARLNVVVRYPGSTLEGSFLRYWINTVPKNPGPEFMAYVIPNSDGFGLMKITKFGQVHGPLVNCPGVRARADMFSTRPVTTLSIPASCLGAPNGLNVAVQTRHNASSDWAKAPQTFLPRVTRF